MCIKLRHLIFGFPSGSVFYTGSALSSGKASWVQLLATCAPSSLSLRLLLVAQPSVPLLGVTSWFHMPALLLCSTEHSLLLVQQRGMSCHLSFGYLLAFTRLPSTPIWRLFCMIRPGLGAPLSRALEEALYKFYDWLIDWLIKLVSSMFKDNWFALNRLE